MHGQHQPKVLARSEAAVLSESASVGAGAELCGVAGASDGAPAATVTLRLTVLAGGTWRRRTPAHKALRCAS